MQQGGEAEGRKGGGAVHVEPGEGTRHDAAAANAAGGARLPALQHQGDHVALLPRPARWHRSVLCTAPCTAARHEAHLTPSCSSPASTSQHCSKSFHRCPSCLFAFYPGNKFSPVQLTLSSMYLGQCFSQVVLCPGSGRELVLEASCLVMCAAVVKMAESSMA